MEKTQVQNTPSDASCSFCYSTDVIFFNEGQEIHTDGSTSYYWGIECQQCGQTDVIYRPAGW